MKFPKLFVPFDIAKNLSVTLLVLMAFPISTYYTYVSYWSYLQVHLSHKTHIKTCFLIRNSLFTLKYRHKNIFSLTAKPLRIVYTVHLNTKLSSRSQKASQWAPSSDEHRRQIFFGESSLNYLGFEVDQCGIDIWCFELHSCC